MRNAFFMLLMVMLVMMVMMGSWTIVFAQEATVADQLVSPEKVWASVVTLLLAISEILAFIPKIKANSVFQLVWNGLKRVMDGRTSIALLLPMLLMAGCVSVSAKICTPETVRNLMPESWPESVKKVCPVDIQYSNKTPEVPQRE